MGESPVLIERDGMPTGTGRSGFDMQMVPESEAIAAFLAKRKPKFTG